MRVLALDQATNTGWAVGEPTWLDTPASRKKIEVGHFKLLKRPTIGERLVMFEESVIARIDFYKPDLIAYEAPYFPPPPKIVWTDGKPSIETFKVGIDVVQFLQKIEGLLLVAATKRGVPVEAYRSPAWRKTFIGEGFPENPKAAAVARARMFGITVETEDEADAVGILWHSLVGPPAKARAQGDLFQMAEAAL